MTHRLSSRFLIPAIAALVAGGSLGAPVVASGAVPTGDLLAFDSVDDFIGQGDTVHLEDNEASFAINGLSTPSSLVVRVSSLDGRDWLLEFDAPLGQTLHLGSYPNAARPQPLGLPAIDISGNGRGCNATSGDFTIVDLATDGAGIPTSAAVAFDQSCEAGFGLMVGRIRVGSSAPIASLSLPHTSRVFENTIVGATAAPRTYTVSSDGDFPVAMGRLAIVGANLSDFTLVSDGCSDQVLDPGDDCSYSIGFTPSAPALRHAAVSVPSDLPNTPRIVPLVGWGLIPTVTTVTVAPDSIYFPPGLVYQVHVAPDPGGNPVSCIVDGVTLAGGIVDQGIGRCYGPRAVGSHTFVGRYGGSPTYGQSSSEQLVFEITPTTVLSLDARPSDGTGTLVSATVATTSALLYPGGTLTIRDDTAGSVVGSLAIDAAHPTLTLSVSFSVGKHHLSAAYDGVPGVLDPSSVALDIAILKPPTTISRRFPSGASLGVSTVPFKFGWTAPATVGVYHYDASLSTDGHAYRLLGSTVAKSFAASLVPGHRYRFRVRARDSAGNGSAWLYGASFALGAYRETSSAIRYAGAWHGAWSTSYFGNADEYSTAAGASARFRFTGRFVAWVASRGPTRGSVRVYVDGRYKTTVNLHSATLSLRRIVWSATFATSGSHSLTLQIVGTHGHPRGDVDAFLVAH